MSILVTGSNGFIGSYLCEYLESLDLEIRPIVQAISSNSPKKSIEVGRINGNTDYKTALSGIDTIIHTAAITHSKNKNHEIYHEINVLGTKNLALQAISAGVRRFIFISTIKVIGETTPNSQPFDESTPPHPRDIYGQSKYEAEEVLKEIAQNNNLEIVIIRPPLVYGPKVKANFNTLLRLSDSGLPLPIKSIRNQRSMIYIGNLTNFITHCIHHPRAKNNTFLISDGEDISLSELISLISKNMKNPAKQFSVPTSILKIILKIINKEIYIDRILNSLQVNSNKARETLHWSPPYTLEKGIFDTTKGFYNGK